MKINDIIKEKRQELGLTQSYIADYLNISVQAVSKWEKGTTYPDISLLPILARLLKIDLNTLFSFHESLTEFEINQFINTLVLQMEKHQNFEEVFKIGMDKVKEYPSCELLASNIAILMEQFMSIYKIKNRSIYQDKIDAIYDTLINSDDEQLRNETILTRIPLLLEEKKYDKAETLINSLPDAPLDKRVWHAEIYLKQERYSKATEIYEEKLLDLVSELHLVLWGISLTSIHQNKMENAQFYAHTHEKVMKIFDLHEYYIYTAQFDIAITNKDTNKSMYLLKQLFHTVKLLHEPSNNPFRLILKKYIDKTENNFDEVEYLTNLLINDIKNKEELEFIRNHPDYEYLL